MAIAGNIPYFQTNPYIAILEVENSQGCAQSAPGAAATESADSIETQCFVIWGCIPVHGATNYNFTILYDNMILITNYSDYSIL